MDKGQPLYTAGSVLGLSGIVLIGSSLLCALAHRVAKLLEVALADVGGIVAIGRTGCHDEHEMLSSAITGAPPNPPLTVYSRVLRDDPLYLKEIRGVKIHLVHWSKRLATWGSIAVALAALAYAYLSVSH